ncbi:dihydrodipicolinate synthase family protein [Microvirga calopogonii]|uniref:dihydrodipicolinate synthase family protein n=1 Tax=Microvirga calopogonii TaxID=2078013 RepID=UPI000E0DD7C1|nr:dihydrodipicolinate synthase family protein [Microvirga calopogonii]
MLTTIETSHLARSVLAVPPFALTADFEINREANAKLIRHLEAGGVSTLLYGGNANVHNWPVSKFAEWLDSLEESVADDTWLIPSVGPDWGKLVDEAAILKSRRYPVAMALPMIAPQTPEGVVRGLQDFVDRSGVPLIVYIKTDQYVPAKAMAKLVEQGAVFGIKYAVPRADLTQDGYLQELIDAVGAERIVSGFGEPPAFPHLTHFKLAGFTAGCVCIAPHLSMSFLHALKRGDEAEARRLLDVFLPLEAIRERHNAIRVLHTAVSLSGVADMGPILPLLTEADPAIHGDIREAAKTLLAAEMTARQQAAAA